MFNTFKRLFSKHTAPPPPEIQFQPLPAPSPAEPAPVNVRTPALVPAPTPPPAPTQTGDSIHLSLNDILAHLPVTVAPFVLARPGGTFSFPVRDALEQLGTGVVRVRFALLRQAAMPGTFKNDASQDSTLIDLPLPQILMALGPAAFSRRVNQKVTTLPDDVTAVFGPNGNVAHPAPPPPPAPAPIAQPKPAAVAAPVAPASKPIRVELGPVAKPAAPIPIKPITPAPTMTPKPVTSSPLPFAAQKPASPLPFATARPTTPVATIAAVPAPVPTPVLAAPDEGVLEIPIGAICESWPDIIRQEILQCGLGESAVSIPMSRLESGMKGGRVIFNWGEMMGWLNTRPAARSSQEATTVELPLKVVAPLYLAKRRAGTPQRKVFVSSTIPDLFGGLVKPAAPPAETPAPAAVVAAPAPPPVPVPEVDKLGELLGQPTKSEWAPPEIVQRIVTFPGVSGSLLATTDGLLVAGIVPEPLNAETLAAFVPQIFERVSSYSEETLIGTLRGVTLRTDIAPCAMFKAGRLHLAVLGKRGENLPEPLLSQIAGELAKRIQ